MIEQIELNEKDKMIKQVKNIYYDIIVPYLETSKCEILKDIDPNSSFLFVEFFKDINKYYNTLED